jgi:ribulose-bisphosphate carboxylase large chain
MNGDEIEVVYRVRSAAASVGARAEALLLEQTVELPRRAIRSDFVLKNLVGRVVATEEVGADLFRVTLAQPALAAEDDPAQLLNVLFGNCSLQADVELEDVRLPLSLLGALGGPRFGAAGLRRLAGAQGRALTASVLKPIGLPVPEMAGLCRTLALSGLDFIKDDHGLADHSFSPFTERVPACLAATEEAARETGHRSIYVPNLTGSPETIRRQARQAREFGARIVMVSPMLMGLPFFNEFARDLGLPVLAHPAFGGAQRIAPRALLGRLFPAFGADAVIYPNAGGRFGYGRDECLGIAEALRSPGSAILPALPVPAGGIRAESVPDVLEFYGAETMLLIGGSLLESPDAAMLLSRCRRFVAAVHAFPYPK